MFHVKHMSGWAIAAQAAASFGSKLLDREWGINSANRINDHQYNNSLDYQRNVYSAQVEGLRAAGLNPILAATNGGSFTGSAGAAPMGGSDAISTASQVGLNNANKKLIDENANLVKEKQITERETQEFLRAQSSAQWNNAAYLDSLRIASAMQNHHWQNNPSLYSAMLNSGAITPYMNSASNFLGGLPKALINSILSGKK